MKLIHKYKVEFGGGRNTILMLPAGAQILTVQPQDGEGYFWAIIDPLEPLEPREILIAGTGSALPKDIAAFRYMGTFQVPSDIRDAIFVWHIFEKLPTAQ